MRLLLDSHVVIWLLDDSPRLGTRASEAIDTARDVYVSAVTPWELSIKRSLGKLRVTDNLSARLVADGYTELPIRAAHGEAAGTLPLHHRDPFDRILIAQARAEMLTIVSADSAFLSYDVDVLDAVV